MRLSHFAQDRLLSHIYSLEDIDEADRTTFEHQLLAIALLYDRERKPEPVACNCGEEDEAFITLTTVQHAATCAKNTLKD